MIGVTPSNIAQIQLTAVASQLSGCYPVLAQRTLGVHNKPKRFLVPLEPGDVGCLAGHMQDHPARSVVGFVDGAEHELRNLDRAELM
jgi:hypothetical protein